MNRKKLVCFSVVACSLMFLLIGAGLAYAAGNDAFIGTWKLNEAKSKLTAGLPKSTTVTYAMDGDNVKCSIDATDAKGQPYHSEWTGKFDGKDYPLTGDPADDMRAYKMVNDHTLVATSKSKGKAGISAHIVVSADGKTRTVTIHGTGASGKRVTSTAVYDKQ